MLKELEWLNGLNVRNNCLSFDRVINLATVNGDFFGSLHAETYFVASNLDDHDRNVIVDDNTLVFFAR